MNNYNIYTNNINKVFNLVDTLDKEVQNEGNNNYIENLKQHKQSIIEFSKIIETLEVNNQQQTGENVQ